MLKSGVNSGSGNARDVGGLKRRGCKAPFPLSGGGSQPPPPLLGKDAWQNKSSGDFCVKETLNIFEKRPGRSLENEAWRGFIVFRSLSVFRVYSQNGASVQSRQGCFLGFKSSGRVSLGVSLRSGCRLLVFVTLNRSADGIAGTFFYTLMGPLVDARDCFLRTLPVAFRFICRVDLLG